MSKAHAQDCQILIDTSQAHAIVRTVVDDHMRQARMPHRSEHGPRYPWQQLAYILLDETAKPYDNKN